MWPKEEIERLIERLECAEVDAVPGVDERAAPMRAGADLDEYLIQTAKEKKCGADAAFQCAKRAGHSVTRDHVRALFAERRDDLPEDCTKHGPRARRS